MRFLFRAAAATALMAGALAACRDAPPTAPAADDPEVAVAEFAADDAAEQIELMRAQGLPSLAMPGLLLPPLAGRERDCRPAQGGRRRCPPVSRDGLTVTRTVTFYDAAGAVQEAFDPQTTAAINFLLSVTGGDGASWSVNSERDLTASGLLGAETTVTWNGSGTIDVWRKLPAATRPSPGVAADQAPTPMLARRRRPTHGGPPPQEVRVQATTTVENVIVPVPHTRESWPLSGTITAQSTVTMTLQSGEIRTVERTAVVTFNGTRYVPLTIGDRTVTIDLARRRGHRG